MQGWWELWVLNRRALSHRHSSMLWPSLAEGCPLVVPTGTHSLHSLSQNNSGHITKTDWLTGSSCLSHTALGLKTKCIFMTSVFLSVGVWWAYLYPNETALLSPEQRRLHRAIQGLLCTCPTFRWIFFQQPSLPASTGLPVSHHTFIMCSINSSSRRMIFVC